jgi:hypothetical protein
MGRFCIIFLSLFLIAQPAHAGFIAAAVAAVASAAGALGGVLVSIASSLALSFLSSLFAKKPKPITFDLGGLSFMVKEPVEPQKIVYGYQKLSGPIAFLSQEYLQAGTSSNTKGGVEFSGVEDIQPQPWGTLQTKNDLFSMVIMLTGHEIEDHDQIYFDDTLVWDRASGNLGTEYQDKFAIERNHGTDTQSALKLHGPNPSDKQSAKLWYAARWDKTRRCRGMSHVGVTMKYNADVFHNGVPNVSVVVYGKKVWDPIAQPWAGSYGATDKGYSPNPAWCILDYLLDPIVGRGVSLDEIDLTSFMDTAVACATRGHELHATIKLDQSPEDIISKMLSTFGGTLSAISGKLTLRAAQWTESVITLSEKDLAGPLNVQTQVPYEDRYNKVRGSFYEGGKVAKEYYHVNGAAQTADGKELEIVLDQPFIADHLQAVQVAVIMLEIARGRYTVSCLCNFKALDVKPGDLISLDLERYDFGSDIRFLVIGYELIDSGGTPAVSLTLRSVTEEAFDLLESDVETTTEDLPSLTYELSAPESLLVASGNSTYTLNNDGTVTPRMIISWASPDDSTIQAHQVEVYLSGELVFSEVVPGDRNSRTLPGEAGRTYTVKVAAIGLNNARSSFTETTHVLVGKTDPPTDPGTLTIYDT